MNTRYIIVCNVQNGNSGFLLLVDHI